MTWHDVYRGCGSAFGSPRGQPMPATLTHVLRAGTYVVVVEGGGTTEGNYVLHVRCSSESDAVADSTLVRGPLACGGAAFGTCQTG